jgi:signal transduction histidine kinase/phage shock protein PspC (stress-responsive transcriptional regulator)
VERPIERPDRLLRSSSDRVLLGVAGGIAERLGVDAVVVRLGFVLLALCGGVGFVLYLGTVLISVEPDGSEPAPRRTSLSRTIGTAAILAGVLMLLRGAGLWIGDDVMAPVALMATGSVVLWGRADIGRTRIARFVQDATAAPVRTIAGATLIGAGVIAFLGSGRSRGLLREAPFAAGAVLVGLAVIVGPWVFRLLRQLAEERRERIRSQERATVAAHLHDSVLQTLALIQRSDDPRRMASLARTQERELRSWLYAGRPVGGPTSLSAALERVVAEIERGHAISIESVTVGDAALDEAATALVAAAREAIVNAARHSRTSSVALFVEVEPDAIVAYIRDHGVGFDRSAVGTDRRGLEDSIAGRMRQAGGGSEVTSRLGEGTEVRLQVPRIGQRERS